MQKRLRELLADRDEGIAYDSENLTVSDYLDRWLGAAKGSVRERTLERHEQVVRLHLKPTLGATRLDRLNCRRCTAVRPKPGFLPERWASSTPQSTRRSSRR